MADWLADAVLYQIYPQSFADSNGDGIGDLNGVESKLDYLAWLGVNTVWLNPCFVSPMRDAGYDVADYLAIDPRYGTRDDLAKLVDAAGRRGIRVLLDLVAGHTSDQHPWFQHAMNDPADHRYIWSDAAGRGLPAVAGLAAGVLPAELLPRAARAELRLRADGRRRAVAPAGRRRGAAAEPAGAARHHGPLAAGRRRRASGWTWRRRW